MAAPKADEMFVAKKQDEAVTGDARDDTGRLKSSGMERDRTDKNPVGDEHDFSQMRNKLGGKGGPKTDDEKLEAAKAKVGIEPGVAKVSNQMFVAKKDAEAVTGDARDDSGRLKSSGMERDRTDKNPVGDEFNFADLRKSLGAKKAAAAAAAEAPPKSPSVAASQGVPPKSPTVVPPTPQKRPSSKAGSVASMPRSTAGDASPAPASPAASAQRVSRQGSTTQPIAASPSSRQPSMAGTPRAQSVSSPMQPASAQPQAPPSQGTPQQPASPSQAGGLSRHSSTRSVQQSVAPSAAQELPPPTRTSSRAGSVNGSVAGSVAASQPRQVGSVAGSQPPLSRQGSAMGAVSNPPVSRQASAMSHHTRVSQQPYSPASTQQPAPVPQQEDELAGVDWKLTANKVKKKLAETEKKLEKKDEELRVEKADAREMRNKVRELEGKLEQALAAPRGRDSTTGECHTCPMLRSQVEGKQAEVKQLEGKVRELEGRVGELKNTVNRGSSSSMQHVVQVQEMQKEIVKYKAAHESREGLIKQLTLQLEAAHNAILSSAQKGFEYDIKLHQARATLVSMLKEERESPHRGGSASPRYAGRTSASPTAQTIHHYSPTIKTPASPKSLR